MKINNDIIVWMKKLRSKWQKFQRCWVNLLGVKLFFMIKRKTSALPELKIIYGIGLMQKWGYFTSFFKGKNCSRKIKSQSLQNTLNKKMPELNVANYFKYSLLSFMLNINLTFYNIEKSSVDGDRSRVFWITQKLKPLRKIYKKEYFL